MKYQSKTFRSFVRTNLFLGYSVALLLGVGYVLSLLSTAHAGLAYVPATSKPIAYPNPWRAPEHNSRPLQFSNLPANSTVAIFTIAGEHVATVNGTSNGTAEWPVTNENREPVASGVYIYSVNDGEATGKIADIR